MAKDKTASAFPRPLFITDRTRQWGGSNPEFPITSEGGMTLLEHYAGQALVGMGMWQPPAHLGEASAFASRARFAFDQAEAMIAERDRRNAEG